MDHIPEVQNGSMVARHMIADLESRLGAGELFNKTGNPIFPLCGAPVWIGGIRIGLILAVAVSSNVPVVLPSPVWRSVCEPTAQRFEAASPPPRAKIESLPECRVPG
jgi:hypothetical protein